MVLRSIGSLLNDHVVEKAAGKQALQVFTRAHADPGGPAASTFFAAGQEPGNICLPLESTGPS